MRWLAVILAAVVGMIGGVDMAQAQLRDKQLNQLLSDFMGRRIRVGYAGGAVPLWQTPGTANPNVGRIHINRGQYDLLLGQRPAKGLPLALGILSHELGHHSDAGRNVPPIINETGGIDADTYRKAQEDAADQWARENAMRVAMLLGYTSKQGRAALRAFAKFRAAHPYHGND